VGREQKKILPAGELRKKKVQHGKGTVGETFQKGNSKISGKNEEKKQKKHEEYWGTQKNEGKRKLPLTLVRSKFGRKVPKSVIKVCKRTREDATTFCPKGGIELVGPKGRAGQKKKLKEMKRKKISGKKSKDDIRRGTISRPNEPNLKSRN